MRTGSFNSPLALVFTLALVATSLFPPLAPSARADVKTSPSQTALSKYDKMLISVFTGTAYEFINPMADRLVDAGVPGIDGPIYLGQPEQEEPDLKFYVQLSKAMAKLPPFEGSVYRGVYTSHSPEERYFPGRVYFERRFTSTSKKPEIANEFANGAYDPELRNLAPEERVIDPARSVLITIKTRTGRDIAKLSLKPEEEEVLLVPGIFKVVEAKRDENKRFHVLIEELDPAEMSESDKASLRKSEEARTIRLKAQGGPGALKTDLVLALWKKRYADWKKSGYLTNEDLTEDMFAGGD